MRKITLNVDDNTKIISFTTFSEFITHNNANAMARGVHHLRSRTMPYAAKYCRNDRLAESQMQ